MDLYVWEGQNFSSYWDQPGLVHAKTYEIPAPYNSIVPSLETVSATAQWQLNLVSIVILFAPFIITYPITLWKCIAAQQQDRDVKRPALVPYWIPLFGHVISYLWDAARLASSITTNFGSSTVVRLQFLSKDIFVVSGAENLNSVWKNTKGLTSTNGICIALSNMFNTSKKDMKFFYADNSGLTHDPHPNSRVRPEDRIFYLMHKATVDCLAGPHLAITSRNFQTTLKERIADIPVGNEWVELPDLYTWLRPHISHATVKAMCGSFFLKLNPTFVQDFWEFDKAMPKLLQGWPRWVKPSAWRAREKCIEGMQRWRKLADGEKSGAVKDPDFPGNEMIRARWNYFSKMEGLSDEGVASSDLGILWGMNSNSMPSTFWTFFEILRDPRLFSRVRSEVDACTLSSSDSENVEFDLAKLTNQPLLQSIYAETLRLRTAVYIIRKPEFQDAQIGDYAVPKDKMIVISSHVAHMDKRNFNTGRKEFHPIERFWADRFLTYPKPAKSGPEPSDTDTATPAPKFSLNGYSGAWIPFGGGIHQCPGRHWVKLQIISSFAMMSSAFDIELLDPAYDPQMNTAKYGLGAMGPKNQTPFRIRRRRSYR